MATDNATQIEAYAQQLRNDLAHLPGTLPLLQGSAVAALEMAQKPNIDFDEITALAASDPSLAARFLSTANSALYFRGTRVSSLKTAVVRLGVQEARDVLFMAVYSNVMLKIPRYRVLVDSIFWHSVLVARTARDLATRLGEPEDQAFMAGLLHDVGWAYCLKLASRRYAANTAHSDALMTAVRQLHAAAGSILATTWRLPQTIAEACEHHHSALAPIEGSSHGEANQTEAGEEALLDEIHLVTYETPLSKLTQIVAVVNAIARRIEQPPRLQLPELIPLLAQLGDGAVNDAENFLKELREQYRQTSGEFTVPT